MRNIAITIIILMVVCCDSAEAKYESVTIEPEVTTPVEIELDDMVFEDAFAIQHKAKGEGRTFWWNGNLYTTNLSSTVDEFVLMHANDSSDKMLWVLNNDDPDDDCYYNKRDVCGVCNGLGKTTWWRDRDGDGLGNHRESIKSCYNPNVDEDKFSSDLGILN